MNSLKSLFFVLLVLLVSCAKDDTESLYENNTTPEAPLQLVKIASWNSVSGMEVTQTEFMYETNGKIKKFFHNKITLVPSYNAAGKVVAASGVNEKGGIVSYTFDYNTGGQIAKVVYLFMNPTDYGYTRTFDYNAAGKVSKITTISAIPGSSASVAEYVWKGDNIESSTITTSTATYSSRYIAYDDKLNPYRLTDGLAAILAGFPPSKNNFTELNTTSGVGLASIQKRTYTYHSSGYALNVSLSDGGNELTRYYYSK